MASAEFKAKSQRQKAEPHSHHAAVYVAEELEPLPKYQFVVGRGPEAQQHALERQGWKHEGRQLVALHCPKCDGFIMIFYAANAALAVRYKDRLCSHQFSVNRGHKSKYEQHMGLGQTKGGKERIMYCVRFQHQQRVTSAVAREAHPCVIWCKCVCSDGHVSCRSAG